MLFNEPEIFFKKLVSLCIFHHEEGLFIVHTASLYNSEPLRLEWNKVGGSYFNCTKKTVGENTPCRRMPR